MPAGVSPVQYPEQPLSASSLELDNSYFLIKLHDAQAFFNAGFFARPKDLTISSSVKNSFQPDSPPAQSLHQITSLTRNVPCHLGLSFNLTDWLPARTTDWLHITLDYNVVQSSPIKNVIDNLEKSGLSAVVSAVSAQWAVAVKVSGIVGRLMSSLTGEGRKIQPFSLDMNLNLSTLKTGYYAVIGSQRDEPWPSSLCIDTRGSLTDKSGHALVRLSYIVVEVLGVKRRGSEDARGQRWWEFLQLGKEMALHTESANSRDRNAAFNNWRYMLDRVRDYAREAQGYLLNEIDDMIREAHVEVQTKLQPTAQESFGDTEFPAEWQEALGVRTEQELQDSVRNYKETLQVSQHLLEQYKLSGS